MSLINFISELHFDYIYHLRHDHKGIDLDGLLQVLQKKAAIFNNPNTQRFYDAYNNLPDLVSTPLKITKGIVSTTGESIKEKQRYALEKFLLKLKPWRKGPFNFFGVDIDAEWQSNMKWERLSAAIPCLKNKKILDIGCNNGYYMFRMLEQQPRSVLGIDPSQLCAFQFAAAKKYIQTDKLFYNLMGVEDITVFENYFDVIFCMGVLYHNRSPLEVLSNIRRALRSGTLVLETLIYPGSDSVAFFPEERYAKMRNIYFLPTETCLLNWLKRVGFKKLQTISIEETTAVEQRQTKWVELQTLNDFLDPEDKQLTVEGYPAHVRIIILANL